MKKIVVGFDGSDASRDALRLAEIVRAAGGAPLVLALVDEIDPLVAINLVDVPTREAHYSEVFGAAAEQLGHQDFERRTVLGSAPQGLDLIAAEEEADLLVVGSTHRGTLGRVLPGSVGDRLLSGAPCAVAVAPKGYASRPQPPVYVIGVGYDGELESRAALEVAKDLALTMGASLRLVAASPPLEELEPGRISHTAPGYARYVRGHLERQLEEADQACDPAVQRERVVEEGEPADVLATQSVELDLLVIGSRGYGPLRRTMLGGVASKLMRLAACPVLVVPRSATTEPREADDVGAIVTGRRLL